MTYRKTTAVRAYTLIEVVLVVGLLLLISAIALPNFYNQLAREQLPTSADQLRALIILTRANAAFDAKRYRIRFPRKEEEEEDALGTRQQPIVEREDDPMIRPEEFFPVTANWAVGQTLLSQVRCAEIRLGRPSIEDLKRRRESATTELDKAFEKRSQEEKFERELPPIYIEPDGTSDWATLVLTEAPADVPLDELYDHPGIDVIVDGLSGLCWLQRPFFDEELDLFEEKNWPAVLRKDFLTPQMLTERDVLELRDIPAESQGKKTTAAKELEKEEGQP
jgi:type II secretory pathway pseudopilin PulG